MVTLTVESLHLTVESLTVGTESLHLWLNRLQWNRVRLTRLWFSIQLCWEYLDFNIHSDNAHEPYPILHATTPIYGFSNWSARKMFATTSDLACNHAHLWLIEIAESEKENQRNRFLDHLKTSACRNRSPCHQRNCSWAMHPPAEFPLSSLCAWISERGNFAHLPNSALQMLVTLQ